MKTFTIIWFLAIFISCKKIESIDDNILFGEPQPQNINDIKAFPRKIHGNYISDVDSSELLIDTFKVVYKSINVIKSHINEFDSLANSENEIINLLKNEGYFVYVISDTIVLKLISYDTLFSFAKANTLRYHHRFLYLNNEISKNRWKLYRIGIFRMKKLSFETVILKDSILKKFDNIIIDSTKIDTNYYEGSIRPSKKDLEKIFLNKELVEKKIFRQK